LAESEKTKSAELEPNMWRIIMKSRITKFAAAAVIIIAVLIGVNEFGGSIDGAGVAFAEVLEHIRTSNYTFDLTVLTEDQASSTVQAMVLEPGRMRVDSSVGLGKVSSIIDISEGKSLLLFHQFKTGQIREVPTPGKDDGAGGIFALCMKPIENLWDLRDGTEEELGEKEIDGQIAEGFKTSHEDQYFQYETTIWAHAKTGVPILVEMVATPLEGESGWIQWTMSNFALDVELAEDLFSLEVPGGYTLAYQLSLDELETETRHSAGAEKIEEMLKLWSSGKKTKAVEVLLGIDWKQTIEFADKPYVFTITEKEYVSLKPEYQEQVMEEVMATGATIREIVRELWALGSATVSDGNYEEAERHFEAALELGKLLTHDPELMLITRLVGIAVERKTLNEMISLYKVTNEQKKLQAAEKELQAMETELEKIKKKARGL
jgi:outer membrane lipoprotein-sorting protein